MQSNKKIGSRKYAMFGFVGLLALLVIMIMAGIYFVYPTFAPNKYRGEFMDLAIVPQKDGTFRVWSVVDASLKIPIKKKSGSNYSNTTGIDCRECRLQTYIIDPSNGIVLNKSNTDLSGATSRLFLVYEKGKVWLISPEYYETEPRIETYDAETGKMLTDTKGFISKFTVLNAGLAAISYNEYDKIITIKTKDAKDKIIYSIERDKLYDTPVQFNEDKKLNSKAVSLPVLTPESSTSPERMKLFKVSGPKPNIDLQYSFIQKTPASEITKFTSDSIRSEPLGDRIYINGNIVCLDEDCCIISSAEETGNNPKRILSCADIRARREKWAVNQEIIFQALKIDQSKVSSVDRLFTPENLRIKRMGKLVTLGMKEFGIIAIDYETGKVLWSMAF